MNEIKKIIFVNPNPYYAKGTNEATIYPPLGMGYLASIMEKEGYECKIIDAIILNLTNKKVFNQIKKFNPDYICISANIITIRSANELSLVCKKLNKIIIMGGVQPTTAKEEVLKTSKCDFIVYGEGEETFKELIKSLDSSNFNPEMLGIAYIKDNKLKVNPPRPFIQDLDSIPFPAFHLFPNLRKYHSMSKRLPMAPIICSRGCPYLCTYCNHTTFGFKFRKRSPENIIAEIEYLQKKFGVKQIDFLDDNFTMDIEHANKLLDLIIEKKIKVAININNGLRADRLTRQLVPKMKKAGIFKVGVGVETGDSYIMKKTKKSLDLEKVKTAIRWLKEEKIIVNGFFMFGLPYDTEKTMQKTIDFALKLNPHLCNFNITVPFPGTELYETIEKEGKFLCDLKKGMEIGFHGSECSYYLEGMDSDKVLKYQEKAFRLFYLRPSKIWEITKLMFSSWGQFKWTVNATYRLVQNMMP